MPLSLFLLVYLLLFVFGYAFSTVLHFAIEDYFKEHAVQSIFFGYSYTHCFAYILVLSVFISACLLIWKKYFFCEEEKNMTISAVKNILKDCIFCISAFASIFYCVKTVYLYLIDETNIPSLLKIAVNVGLIAVFMLFVFLDRKGLFNKNFKLFFRSTVSAIFLVVMSTVLCVCKFSNLESIVRVRSDVKTFRCLKDIESMCLEKSSQDNINDKIYNILDERRLEKNINYKIDEGNVELTFKVKSYEQDRLNTRSLERAVGKYVYRRSDIKKCFDEYKQPGVYTKTFVRRSE